jgi:hypothetical protein
MNRLEQLQAGRRVDLARHALARTPRNRRLRRADRRQRGDRCDLQPDDLRHGVGSIASVASFYVSRVDGKVDALLPPGFGTARPRRAPFAAPLCRRCGADPMAPPG